MWENNEMNCTCHKPWKKALCVLLSVIIAFGALISLTASTEKFENWIEMRSMLSDYALNIVSTKGAISVDKESMLSDNTQINLQNRDGSNTVYLFSEPVSYIDKDGKLQTKDISVEKQTDKALKAKGYEYTNGQNDYRINFSKDLSKGLYIEFAGGSYSIIPQSSNAVNGNKNVSEFLSEQFEDFEYQYRVTVDGEEDTLDIQNQYDSEGRITATGYNEYDIYYQYDSNGQLIRVDNAPLSHTATVYSYDSRGNVTQKKVHPFTYTEEITSEPAKTTTFTYANSGWKDQLIAVDGVELTYDEIGNVLTFGSRSFTWNSGRNLTQITDSTNIYSYTYDENGIRTSKTVNGATTYYNTKDGVILSQSDGTNTMYFQYDSNGVPLGFILNGVQYFYLTNQMGDVIAVTETDGEILCEYVYDEWGQITSVFFPDAATAEQRMAGNANPLRYRGYYYDNETGYYYLQSRYYDPSICRFINADIPEIASMSRDISVGMNLFAYCNNNAVNNSDPLGLWVASLVGISMNFIAITGGTFSLQWVFDGYGNNGILVIGSIGFGFSVGISWSTFFSWRRTIFDLRGISQNLYLGLVPFRAFGVGIGITFSFDKRGFCGLGVSAGFSVSRFEGFYAFSVAEIINLPSYKYRTPTRAQALRILRSNAWRLSKRIYKIYRR